MEEQIFKLPTEDGEQTCKVIFTFDTDDHSYCLYSVLDEEGNETDEISAVRYELDENLNMTDFQEIETEEEWDMVQEVYATLVDTFSETESEDDFFTVTDEDGVEIECEVLHRFELKEFGKKYLLYTFANEEPIGDIFAASYIESEDGGIQEIFPIESEEEWEKVEQTLDFLYD